MLCILLISELLMRRSPVLLQDGSWSEVDWVLTNRGVWIKDLFLGNKYLYLSQIHRHELELKNERKECELPRTGKKQSQSSVHNSRKEVQLYKQKNRSLIKQLKKFSLVKEYLSWFFNILVKNKMRLPLSVDIVGDHLPYMLIKIIQ